MCRCVAVGRVYRLKTLLDVSRIPKKIIRSESILLLTEEVSEICDSVFTVSDKLLFSLLTVVLFSINVG